MCYSNRYCATVATKKRAPALYYIWPCLEVFLPGSSSGSSGEILPNVLYEELFLVKNR
jgi:hypothetical protein